MIVLGINSVYHESSAALVVNGRVVAAAEEERFNRAKHGKPARVNNPHELPIQSIEFCLKSAGLAARDLDAVCYSFDPRIRRYAFREDKLSRRGDWGDREGEEIFLSSLAKVPERTSAVLAQDITDRFHWVPHHMAHAASAFFPSGFEEAAVLVVDGIGEYATTLMAAGQGRSLTRLKEFQYPHSLGFLWEKLSKFLGFSEYDACKVMGLAGYGNPTAVEKAFQSFLEINGGRFRLDPEVMELRLDSFRHLEARLGKRRERGEPIHKRHADIAAALQSYNDRIMLALVGELYNMYPAHALCLAGGVALNCRSNWVVKEQGPYHKIYIPTAPHDGGTAVGAALYVYFKNGGRGPAPEVMDTVFIGPEYSDGEIVAALRAEGVTWRRRDDIARDAATLIGEGKIVGWFQGRMEFGPRALGNRSLLADPRDQNTRRKLNRRVKHREVFRPFAPSIIGERCAEWFEIGHPSDSYSYMLFACPVRGDKAQTIPAVIHVDGTSRIQVVTKEQNPRYHRLISYFEKVTGVPLVLNTSLNDSEPIVCSPRDALVTFKNTEIDALAIGDFLVGRSSSPGDTNPK